MLAHNIRLKMYDIQDDQRRMVDAVRASNFACKDNELLNTFFSQENINRIQTQLRVMMKDRYGYRISRQDDTELVLIMRGIYNMNDSVVVPSHTLRDQVEYLNARVLEYVIPQLRTNIRHYLGYLRDTTRPYQLLDRPRNTSQRGEHTLFL